MKLRIRLDGQVYEVQVEKNAGDYKVVVGDSAFKCVPRDGGVSVNGEFVPIKVDGELDAGAKVTLGDRLMQVAVEPVIELEKMELAEEETKEETGPKEAHGNITAPMPGKVISVKVKSGDKVQPNTLVLILEAMKMENEILAGMGGTIKEVRVKAGEAVEGGKVLVVIE
ncbi:MAG TPA: biotin/lipoyl-containing protein [Methanomassiliicoccales archaeon]|nr:biotin/lipoyl-containing protein [Methanomassiliicoccales archaeon]